MNMNRKTKTPITPPAAPQPPMSAAEWVALLQRFADLERKYEALKNSKLDWKLALAAGFAVAFGLLGILNLNSNARLEQMQTHVDERFDDANENVNKRFDDQNKRLGNIERLLMEGRSQPAVYYPTVP